MMQVEATLLRDSVHIKRLLCDTRKFWDHQNFEGEVLGRWAHRIGHNNRTAGTSRIVVAQAIGVHQGALRASPPVLPGIRPPVRKDTNPVVLDNFAVMKDCAKGACEEKSNSAAIARRGVVPDIATGNRGKASDNADSSSIP